MSRLLLMAAAASLACRNPPASVAKKPAAPHTGDTARGSLVIEGSEPVKRVVLRTATGSVVLSRVPKSLVALSGLELMIAGQREPGGRFGVDSFTVRGFDGRAAWDGILSRDSSGAYALVLADGGRRAVRSPPSAFAALVGQRLWVVESAAGTVSDYGVVPR